MSLITRCPACDTLFRVVPDQLRISDGWVKCGQCNEIFDASQHLVQTEAEPAPVQNPETTHEQVVSEPDSLNAESVQDESLAVLDGLTQAENDAELIVHMPQVTEQGLVIEDLSLSANEEEEVHSDQEFLEVAESAIQSEHVSFLMHSSPTLVWNKPWVRMSLMLFGVVLMLGLIGQWLYYERSRLAAVHPELTALLQSFCVPLNCSIPALQQIESMVIDSAAFNKLGKDGFRLKFAVKNSASMDLAVPDFELTLTDLSDQPIARRILTADELGVSHPVLQAGEEWLVEVALRVKTDASEPLISGYRLVAFYP